MKYLLYTLVNYNTKYYIDIFIQFLNSLALYSDLNQFDLCIITDELTLPVLKNIKLLNQFHVSFIKVPVDKTLYTALFRKFDIFQHPKYMEYEKILFLDCDIIVQENIIHLFESIKAKPNKLYVAEEGEVDGRFWTIDAYLPQDIEYMKKHKIRSFNSGTYLFIPSAEMRDHFVKAKNFGLNYEGKHFYDQSIFNYYFNRLRIAQISKYLTAKLQLFPDTNKYYPNKMLMHLAGIDSYKTKSKRMKKYLEFIKKHK